MGEALPAMKSPLPLLVAALLPLAACNNNKAPEVVDTNPDPMASVLANRAPVELPPAIAAQKSMRCKDNSVVDVTFFQGDKQAVVTAKGADPVKLTAPDAGKPYTADGGWTMTGTASSVTLTQPGKGTQTCKG